MSNVIDARTWKFRPLSPKPTGCLSCGDPIVTVPVVVKIYCSETCSGKAQHARAALRRGEDPPVELHVVGPGSCPVCLASFEPHPLVGRGYCSVDCRRRWARRKDRRRAYGHFRSRVKWPHDLAWLAGKIGIPPDDPRLPEIALRLAEAGKLVAFVNSDGVVNDVGKPRP